jgi:hypothetical protein
MAVFTTALHSATLSIPCHFVMCLKHILLFFFHLRLGLPSGLFPYGFPTNSDVRPCYPHAHFSFCSWSFQLYRSKSTGGPHYAVFKCLVPSRIQRDNAAPSGMPSYLVSLGIFSTCESRKRSLSQSLRSAREQCTCSPRSTTGAAIARRAHHHPTTQLREGAQVGCRRKFQVTRSPHTLPVVAYTTGSPDTAQRAQ